MKFKKKMKFKKNEIKSLNSFFFSVFLVLL